MKVKRVRALVAKQMRIAAVIDPRLVEKLREEWRRDMVAHSRRRTMFVIKGAKSEVH